LESTVHGRICVAGEHSDWASDYGFTGQCLVTNTNQAVSLVGAPSHECSIHENGKTLVCAANSQALLKYAHHNGYMGYFYGVMSHLVEYGKGLSVTVVENTIPKKIGLSSSAAFCCALAELYHKVYKVPYDVEKIMDIAYKGERETGSMCGRMDQYCYAPGLKALRLEAGKVTVHSIKPGAPLHFVVVDFKKEKNTIGILKDLNEAVRNGEEWIVKYFKEYNHIYFSNILIGIQNGDLERAGYWMRVANDGFNNNVSRYSYHLPTFLSEMFLEREDIRALTWGGKEMGSRGDSNLLLLTKGIEESKEVVRIAKDNMYNAYQTEVL
jgi:galactokinase